MRDKEADRCECLIHWSSGNVFRCAAMVLDKSVTPYCYRHKKAMDGLMLSSPEDMPREDSVDREHIMRYTNLEGTERRENRENRKN